MCQKPTCCYPHSFGLAKETQVKLFKEQGSQGSFII